MRAEAELSRLYQQAGAEPSMEEQLEQGVKRPTRGLGGCGVYKEGLDV